MKYFVLRLRNYFSVLFKKQKTERSVFDIQKKIQKKFKLKQNASAAKIILAPIPMAQVTIQTIQIPMVDPAAVKKSIQDSAHVPVPTTLHRRQPSIIRNPLSEKDIADISSILKAFHGNDVRDLF
jgi:hypothetical protein